RNGDFDVVEFGSADHRLDLAFRNLQVDDEAVADVASAARQAALVIAVALEVGAPRLAPERRGDLTAFDFHRRERAAFFPQAGDLALGLPAPLRDRDVRCPLEVGHNYPSFIAAAKSSVTSLINSSSAISVKAISPPPLRKSPASAR